MAVDIKKVWENQFSVLPKSLLKDISLFDLDFSSMYILLILFDLTYNNNLVDIEEHLLAEHLGVSEDSILVPLANLIEKQYINMDIEDNKVTLDMTPALEKIFNEEKVGKTEILIEDYDIDKTIPRDIIEIFEASFNKLLGSFDIDYLKTWLHEDNYPKEMIIDALSVTERNCDQPSFKYIDTVLRNWHNKGVTSEAENLRLLKQKSNKNNVNTNKKNNKSESDDNKYDSIDDICL